MEIKAKLNYLRIAPRKVRLVADLVRGRKVAEARAVLDFSVKKGAKPILKLLNSAIANNKEKEELDEETLRIAKITVDEGPKLKRWRARARGRAGAIQKKTSHITLILEGKKAKKKPVPAKKKVEKAKTEVKAEEKQKEIKAKPSFFRPRKEKTPSKGKIFKKGIFRRKSI